MVLLFRWALLLLLTAALGNALTELGRIPVRGWVRIPTIDPAVHAAFLAWARESGFAHVEPAGIPAENYTWSLLDSSPSEYLYRLNYPVEGGRRVRVFRRGAEWRAVEDPWLSSVGRPSWQEMFAQRLQQERRVPGWQVQVLLEKDDSVVVAPVWQKSPEGWGALDMYHFTRGPDGLWRSYGIYNGVDSTYATPEDALVAFARQNFPALTIGGDCPLDQQKQADQVCWALREETQDRRRYEISPAFHLGNTVELEGYLQGWLARPYELFPPAASSSSEGPF